MSTIESYIPTPKQKEFHQSKAKNRCFLGAFGSGKTKALVWEAIDISMRYKHNVGVICRKTYRELCDTTRKMFFEECPKELIAQFMASENKVILVNGSEILFRSLDDPSKVRSTNLGWFAIDEADEIAETYYMILQGRLRYDKVPFHYGFIATNPPTVSHWIYKYFVERKDPDYFLIKSSAYDNPYLPKGYIDGLISQYPESWIRRYIYGDFGFVVNGDPVFQTFNRKIHVKDKIEYDPSVAMMRGWDFGWHHPCVVWAQYGDANQLKVLWTEMGTKEYLDTFAPKIIKHSNERFPNAFYEDFCDIAGLHRHSESRQTEVDILNSNLGDGRARYRKSNNTVAIELIEKKLRRLSGIEPEIVIQKHHNEVLIEALEGGYCYEKNLSGIPNKKPMEDGYYEHPVDAFKYILINKESINSDRKVQDVQIAEPNWSGGHETAVRA